MKDTCYLTMGRRGIVRMTKGPPSLARGELAVLVAVSMSDAHFTQPAVTATIEIPDSAIIRPSVEVEVLGGDASAIEARSDETQGLGPEGESAAPQGETPNE